jgi:hypothetical protein
MQVAAVAGQDLVLAEELAAVADGADLRADFDESVTYGSGILWARLQKCRTTADRESST